ncbi:MAG: prepilin peptidase [Limnobacter sp.]|nr:prepilin peptidase [Limnobacter sp.]
MDSLLDPTIWVWASALFGLCVGSFLNVVIHRLPIMMERQWEDELDMANEKPVRERARFDLLFPGSHCPSCENRLKWWHNIPIVSFLLLRAKCGFCGARISWRYPAVELFTAGAFVWVAFNFPPGWQGIAWMGFLSTLIALALIDLDTTLLPDDLTLPLMWAGIVFNLIFAHVSLQESVLGAVVGYLMLWVIYHGFKLATGKEGMGYGDFKLMAACGAWVGVQGLLSVLLVASVVGVVFGVGILIKQGKSMATPFPFGPSIVLGLFSWLLGFNVSELIVI